MVRALGDWRACCCLLPQARRTQQYWTDRPTDCPRPASEGEEDPLGFPCRADTPKGGPDARRAGTARSPSLGVLRGARVRSSCAPRRVRSARARGGGDGTSQRTYRTFPTDGDSVWCAVWFAAGCGAASLPPAPRGTGGAIVLVPEAAAGGLRRIHALKLFGPPCARYGLRLRVLPSLGSGLLLARCRAF